MTTVEIERAIGRLPKSRQVALMRKLEAGTWRSRFSRTVTRIRRQAGRISDAEITRLVEDVRRTRHAAGGR